MAQWDTRPWSGALSAGLASVKRALLTLPHDQVCFMHFFVFL